MKRTLLLLALVVAGCTSTAAPPPPPPPKTVVPSATVPLSGVAATSLAGADPCGLLNTQALSRFGEVSIDPDITFTECDARITFPLGGGSATASVGFDFTPQDTTRNDRGGVTIYGGAGEDYACWRYIVISEHETIRATGHAPGGGDPATLCTIADAVVDGMLPILASGQLPPSDEPPDSLSRQDACDLLNHREIHSHAGLAAREVQPGFAGQSCTWTTGDDDGPYVLVTFYRTYPPSIPGNGDREITVAGHTGVMAVSTGSDDGERRYLPGCAVDLVYRPLDDDPDQVEKIVVKVSADRPGKDSCKPVTDLATIALGRLPRR